MDGLTGTLPLGEPEEEICQMSLFEDLQTEKTTPKSKIYNWNKFIYEIWALYNRNR